MFRKIFLLLITFSIFLKCTAQEPYTEMYRPQYHATPKSSFMGDPNGPIKFDGKYHLFWWGHLRSDDMVHWQEINANALNGTPSGFGNWSGSVVMDMQNTAGFNSAEDTAMIAVYTLHEDATGHQHQAISVSLNHGSFDYYSGNPVIDSNEPDFRDPQVFWYEPGQKWVMVITKPVDRGIRIYSSTDLISWKYESTFNGHGARKEVWEVPDLFQLPLNGNEGNKRWVMTCGMGPNRMQFWVGDFDGKTFTIDPDENFFTGAQIQGELFADFESGYSDWTTEGSAFGDAPADGTLTDQMEVMGYTGGALVNSFLNGDGTTGKLISPEFVIDHSFINLQIGGGSNGSTLGFKVIIEGQEVQSIASSSDTEILQWRGVDVSGHMGATAHIEIVDEATGGWGHILVDHIVFSNELYDTRVENANWADWGFDFYAGKTFRNYDNDDNRTIWLAWMGNWTYARDVPTRPWKGNQSIPRSLHLVKEDKGYQLIQKPIEELELLRAQSYTMSSQSIDGNLPVTAFQPEWNVYEMKLSYKIENRDQVFGIKLAQSEDHDGISITYDAATSELEVDRTGTPFSFAFKRISKAPVYFPEDSVLDLHIYVDQASIEVFANDYQTSISSLAFTDANSTGITLFSEADVAELISFEAWDLESIWGITADQVERPQEPVDPTGTLTPGEINCYPNPVSRGGLLTLGNDRVKELVLLSISGNQVMQWSDAHSVNIPQDIDPGLYLLRYQENNQINTLKLIIE